MTEKLGEAAYLNYDLPPADASLNKDDLEIKVSWGVGDLPDDGWRREDDDREADRRHWIEIEDPGTGMTLDVVKKYFTQIGRSYYQSPEYRRDRALFREFGLPASEISQFGIGILSCFMLADMVEVWTCPIPLPPTSQGDCQAYHFRIWGADGLFWHQPTQEKNTPGTRIRMWLKKDRQAGCDAKNLQSDLISEHYGRSNKRNSDHVDPLRTIWASVPWPRYPIAFQPQSAAVQFDSWRLTGTAHQDRLLPLGRHKWEHQYRELFGKPPSDDLFFQWAWWDWEHPGTASRVRIAVAVAGDTEAGQMADLAALLIRLQPTPSLSDNPVPGHLLLPFVTDTLLPERNRTQLLVRGMRVPELSGIKDLLQFGAGIGAVMMIDLSGHAAPRLRADRKASTEQQRHDWPREVYRVFDDWLRDASNRTATSAGFARAASTIIRLRQSEWRDGVKSRHETGHQIHSTNLTSLERPQWWQVLSTDLYSTSTENWYENLTTGQHFARDHTLGRAFLFDGFVNFDPTFEIKQIVAIVFALNLAETFLLNLHIVFEFPEDRDPIYLPSYAINIDTWHPIRDRIDSAANAPITHAVETLLNDICLPELFGPSLYRSLPQIQAPVAAGRGSDARLISPLQLEFQIECPEGDGPSRTVPWESGWAEPAKWLEKFGYDLVMPWTQIPLGELRQNCPAWRSERACRAIAILPFVFSSALNWGGFRKILNQLDERLLLSRVTDILLLVPEKSLDMLPFKDWKKAKTQDKVVTAYWKLDEDRVLWAEGFHNRQSIAKHGRTLEDHAGINTD